jgi:Circadian oscillating protein COP23
LQIGEIHLSFITKNMKNFSLTHLQTARLTHLTRAGLLSTLMLTTAICLPQIAPAQDATQAEAEKVQFVCGSTFNEELNRQVPTTIAWMPDNKYAVIQWVKSMGTNWTPEKRCETFSKSIQTAYQAGNLQFLTNGKVKGQNVICAATEVNGECKTVLMTLRKGDNPLQFLSELKESLNGRSVGVPKHSSGDKQMYYQIDLKKLIATKPIVK